MSEMSTKDSKHGFSLTSSFFISHGFTFYALLFGAYLYCEVAFHRELNLDLSVIIIVFCSFLILSKIKNNYIIFLGYFWVWWAVIGVTNSASWSYIYSNQDLDVERSVFIYFFYICVFLLGALFTGGDNKIEAIEKFTIHPLWSIVILVYPFLMIAESYLRIGYIPILISGDITDLMYNLNYGLLYNYKACMIVSVLLCMKYIKINLDSNNKTKFFVFIFLLFIYLLISLFDGKRVMFLASLLVIAGFLFKVNGRDFVKKYSVYFALLIVFVYVFIALSRGGNSFGENGIHDVFYSIGVEFRDYVWTVTNYEPGEITGYSWALSSIGSFINGGVLTFLGFDKSELVSMDSARSWMYLFEIELGIRTGIVSELWFDYGYAGVIVIFIFGLLLGKVCRSLQSETKFVGFMFYVCLYAFIVLLIMGQSSVFFGFSITLVYLLITMKMFDLIFPFGKKSELL